jgi:hypothetical protein
MTDGEDRRPGRGSGTSEGSRGIAADVTSRPAIDQRTAVAAEFIAIIPKNKREDVRISLSKFNDVDLLNIRVFVEYSDGERGPSKKGISIRVAQLPALLEALQKAASAAHARGLIGGGA